MKKYNKYAYAQQKIYFVLLVVVVVLLGIAIPWGLIQYQKIKLENKQDIVKTNSGLPYIVGEKRLYEHLQEVAELYCSTLELSEEKTKELITEMEPSDVVISKKVAIEQAEFYVEEFTYQGEGLGYGMFETIGYGIYDIGHEQRAILYGSIENTELVYWKLESEEITIIIDGYTGFPVYTTAKILNKGYESFTADTEDINSNYNIETVRINAGREVPLVPLELGLMMTLALKERTDGKCNLFDVFQENAIFETTEIDEFIIYKTLIEDNINLCLDIEVNREQGDIVYEMYFCRK